jgi:hypothetical protein
VREVRAGGWANAARTASPPRRRRRHIRPGRAIDATTLLLEETDR